MLANVDVVDYGEDFTDAAVGAGFVETTYQVVKVFEAHRGVGSKEEEENDKPPKLQMMRF